MIEPAENVQYLETHYELSNWIDLKYQAADSYGLINHLTVSPIFLKHSQFFMRELHRLSNYSVLFYCITSEDTMNHQRDHSFAGKIPRPY